jgi:hypothetical protein
MNISSKQNNILIQVMAKASIVYKIIISIFVLEFITNGDCFKITTQQVTTEINSLSTTSVWNQTSSDLVPKDKVR